MNKNSFVKDLIVRSLTLGSIESLTGGLFASTVTSVPGSSRIFRGALVTYSSEVKTSVANVDKDLIDKYGVVSHEVAYAMAKNAQKILGVDICVSFTGNAGPTALDNLPVGRIYVGLAYKNEISTYEFNIISHEKDQRNDIREQIVYKAMELIEKKI